ncbi:hypothetical protein HLPR_00170 [Helicovermis profundi]|uniref:RNA polymerase sigma-70 region 4 domain-containing protein n=1 Tax=Helicovermis profundi TaxID=3065157 RepID=A0AAU9E0B2_9FIRM|nr:hypothetical protein HLPR_00170 [Clostridia bacterium S502]
MENIDRKNFKNLSLKIEKLVNENSLTYNQEKIIRLRYGIDNEKPASFKEMIKILKISPKELKKEINISDRKVFNLIKSKL